MRITNKSCTSSIADIYVYMRITKEMQMAQQNFIKLVLTLAHC